MDGGGPMGHWGRWHCDTGMAAAIAAPHKLVRAPLHAPQGEAARVIRPKTVQGLRGYSPWVQSWQGMAPRWLTAAA
jgi:hypothetical protein